MSIRALVIGIGNGLRRDDGAGLMAARRLQAGAARVSRRRHSAEPFRVLEHSGEGVGLIDCWEGADAVILLDAVRSGAPPGTIHRWDARLRPLPAKAFRGSSHALGLAEAIELARALGRLPPYLVVYGIEGRDFEAGTALSPEVEAALGHCVARVLEEARGLGAAVRSS